MTSTRASRCGSVWTRSSRRIRRWPWTIARMVPSWRRITWAIFASVPIVYSSSTLPISSCSLERWVTSATGCEVRTARSSALTLRSRPTVSGTIISGKMTVSRSATSGSTWTRSSGAPFASLGRVDLGNVLGLVFVLSCHVGLLLRAERGSIGLIGLGRIWSANRSTSSSSNRS